MKAEVLLEQLETTAERLGVKVSYEQLAASVGHGGLCRVKGQYRVIIDKRATPQERVTTLAAALATIVFGPASPANLAEFPPKVRETLQFYAPGPARKAS